MLKLVKKLFILSLISVSFQNKLQADLPELLAPIFRVISGTSRSIAPKSKIGGQGAAGVPMTIVKPMPLTTPSSSALVVKPEVKKYPKLGRHLFGSKELAKMSKLVETAQTAINKNNADCEKTLHEVKETALIVRYTIIPMAILASILMFKSIFPALFDSLQKKITVT